MTQETLDALRQERQTVIAEILRQEEQALSTGNTAGANALTKLRGQLARMWIADRG